MRKFLRCRRVSAVALALIAGMLAAHFYAIPLWCWGVAALLGLGGACAWRRPGRVGLMLIGVAGLGAALLLLAETRPALPAEEDVTLEGIVAGKKRLLIRRIAGAPCSWCKTARWAKCACI